MIKEIIVVEGRDDVTAVKKACDCEIIITGGYHFPKDLFKRLKKAQKEKGLIVLTDPDYAGERIRKIINKNIKGVKNAYIEQDKTIKNGDIGIENAKPEDILNALKNAKANFEDTRDEFSFDDMVYYELTGPGSKNRREIVGNLLSIGYGNSKQFLKRLNKYNISRKELEEALLKFER
ncbi:ribonuclease M5 [Miniphocaeibacter halophilus]|uniref:Ribonuclease M5 n=1 Tax=Miniphocaeibacter halophilus TaxID=2931922 RepID=A0AC61MQM0_9FIRM|nr:ribonuclease M5 [Miniphocaeibacter halophilus]QQK07985.1 ribonuclease M5 [Miniphocaeibacter halophilus]